MQVLIELLYLFVLIISTVFTLDVFQLSGKNGNETFSNGFKEKTSITYHQWQMLRYSTALWHFFYYNYNKYYNFLIVNYLSK